MNELDDLKDELEEKLKKEWYNVNEVAEILGVSTQTVRRYVRKGTLKAIYEGQGSRMRFHVSTVRNYLINNLII